MSTTSEISMEGGGEDDAVMSGIHLSVWLTLYVLKSSHVFTPTLLTLARLTQDGQYLW